MNSATLEPVPVTEYQIAAYDPHGEMLHCGPRKWRGPVTADTIRRYVRKWELWAAGIARLHPGCGTDKARGRTARVALHPIGRPEECVCYDVATGARV